MCRADFPVTRNSPVVGFVRPARFPLPPGLQCNNEENKKLYEQSPNQKRKRRKPKSVFGIPGWAGGSETWYTDYY